MTDSTDNLSTIREDIDQIDAQIAELVADRLELAERVAEAKSRMGKGIVDEEREERVKSHYADQFKRAGLPPESGSGLAEYLIDISIDQEEQISDRI